MVLIEYKLNKKKKGVKCGVSAMSIVDMPAVMVDFLKLKEEVPEVKLSLDEEQMIITGPALIPNQKIYRTAESLGLDTDGYIYFTEETVKEMAELFMSNMLMNNITLDHETPSEDLSLVETWISVDDEKDKSVALGYKLPKGTWFVSYRVNNPELWKRIKLGEFNGFSIEASGFDRELIKTDLHKEEEFTEDMFAEYIFDRIKAVYKK